MSIRSLGLSVYVPTILFAIGQGAVIPIVALAVLDLDASPAFASVVVALRGIGILLFDVPAGWLITRFGERRAMVGGTLLVVSSLAGSAVAPNALFFAGCTLLLGCGWSIWQLARLTYVSDAVPVQMRGRALSTLGGVNRVGNFIGPFIGAAAIAWIGLDGAYYIHMITAAAALALLIVLMRGADDGKGVPEHERVQLLQVVRENANVFITAGVGTTAIQMLRAARQGVLPLWADHIGLSDEAVSVVFGISTGMDMLLFYPAGSAMDRWGRKAVAIPCLAFMSVGMLLMPLTGSFATLAVVGLIIGFGNGLGSGIVMTLGADFSPVLGRAQFLGAWRLCGDLGTAGGPLVVAGLTAGATLGVSAVAMGVLGALGASLFYLRVPETLTREAPEPG